MSIHSIKLVIICHSFDIFFLVVSETQSSLCLNNGTLLNTCGFFFAKTQQKAATMFLSHIARV